MVLAYTQTTDGTNASFNLTDLQVVISETAGTLNVTAVGGNSITSYRYRYVLQSGNLSTAPETTTSSNSFAITGLTPGQTYKIQVRAYGAGGAYGNAITKEYIYIPIASGNTGIQSSLTDMSELDEAIKLMQQRNSEYQASSTGSRQLSKNKSFFVVNNNSKNKTEYTVAYKSFTQIPTNESYYSFGSTIIFDPMQDQLTQVGGIGFFVGGLGTTGYFLRIRASAGIAAQSSNNEVEIVKVLEENDIPLVDSQKTKVTTASGIYGGKAYKVDIKVKVESKKVTIDAYINGFKITAVDTEPTPLDSIYKKVLPVSNKLAMFSGSGKLNFDYIYGMSLTQKQYESSSLFNIYTGQFSNNQIDFLFGERMLDINSSTTLTNGAVEEFGALAREIRYFKFKFPDRPAIPIAPSTGSNDFIKIIGSKLNHFGAEAYLLNNSGFSTGLSADSESTFMVYGYSIGKTGTLQYDNFDKNLYTSEEPVIFETKWLQSESDVINLADWIKSQWSKKQTILNLEIFGNPLLQVGDIIKIDYPYQGLTTSQKFIILSISNNYQSGLSTTISCRSIS